MLPKLRVDDAAPWKQRYRAPLVLGAQIAKAAPERGLASSNISGVYQLYAWDVPTGALRQLTNRPEGQLFGVLSPDGRFVYYLNDQMGNEIGHFARLPYEGGDLEDITPGLPPYSPAGIAINQAATTLGMMAANAEGFHFYVLPLGQAGALGAPRLIHRSPRITFGPSLSYDGTIAVLASTERNGKIQFNALAFDVAS